MPGESGIGQPIDRRDQFDSILDSHYLAVARYCIRRLGAAEGEDAAADVFAVAWRRLDDIPLEVARTWLLGVAYRVVGNHYRSRQRQLGLTRRLAAEPFMAQAPGGIENDDLLLLRRALSALAKNDREVLQMSMWDELSRQEMAAVLGITENSVDQRLFRARHRLRGGLERLRAEQRLVNTKEAST